MLVSLSRLAKLQYNLPNCNVSQQLCVILCCSYPELQRADEFLILLKTESILICNKSAEIFQEWFQLFAAGFVPAVLSWVWAGGAALYIPNPRNASAALGSTSTSPTEERSSDAALNAGSPKK